MAKIIKDEPELVKRLQSFAWRLGAILGAALIQFALDNIGLINLSPEVTIVLGLILGEVSKWLNKVK